MNSILQLKGRFEQRSNRSRPGSPKLPKGKSVSASHLRELEKQLERILVAYCCQKQPVENSTVRKWKITDRINSRGQICLGARSKRK